MINRVHELAEEEDQQKIASNFKFEWSLEGVLIEDDEGDHDNDDVEELLAENTTINPPLMDVDGDHAPRIMEEQDDDYEVILEGKDNNEEPQVYTDISEEEGEFIEKPIDVEIDHDDVEEELGEELDETYNEGDDKQHHGERNDEHGNANKKTITPNITSTYYRENTQTNK